MKPISSFIVTQPTVKTESQRTKISQEAIAAVKRLNSYTEIDDKSSIAVAKALAIKALNNTLNATKTALTVFFSKIL